MPLFHSLPELGLDRNGTVPLAVQLAEQIRQAVLARRLKAKVRLPSTRALAEELGVSRATVLAAFDQLIAEGYLEGRQGSGTHVAAELPETFLTAGSIVPPVSENTEKNRPAARPFRLGVFDAEEFPHSEWGKLLGRIWRNPSADLLASEDPFGFYPLRRAIARHLHEWRGVAVAPEQIIITAGSADAFTLVREALFKPGDQLWMEEPGYPPARKTLGANGLRVVPAPVDAAGLDVSCTRQKAPDARAAFVTPARHHPTGITMTLARRLDLISWARENDAFIIEDDYDSEHRYVGQPLPALMSLDPERIFYIGSFSKVFSPLLRLGFLIVPGQMTTEFITLRQALLPPPSLLAQPALAHFIETGTFAQHIRRMRRLHAARRRVLLTALAAGEPDLFRIDAPPAGLSILLSLPEGKNDIDLATLLENNGIEVQPLSPLYTTLNPRHGLVLGFSGFKDNNLAQYAKRLIEIIQSC